MWIHLLATGKIDGASDVKRKIGLARSTRIVVLPEPVIVDGELEELTPVEVKKAVKKRKRVLKIEPDRFIEVSSPSKRRNDDEFALLLMI